MRYRTRAWGGWIVAIGLIFLAVSTGLLIKDRRMEAAFSSAWGAVAALDPAGRGYRRVVRFEAEGRMIEIRSRQVSSIGVLGERVSVLYDPKRPDLATIDDFGERRMPAAFFGLVGALISFVGLALLVLPPRFSRSPKPFT